MNVSDTAVTNEEQYYGITAALTAGLTTSSISHYCDDSLHQLKALDIPAEKKQPSMSSEASDNRSCIFLDLEPMHNAHAYQRDHEFSQNFGRGYRTVSTKVVDSRPAKKGRALGPLQESAL